MAKSHDVKNIWRHRKDSKRSTRTRTVGLLAALAVAVTAMPASAGAASTPPVPDKDPFYSAPTNVASYAKGAIIRSRSVSLTIAGFSLPIKTWQLLYKSTDAKGKAVADVTTIIVPNGTYSGGKRPLVSYQAAEDSVGTQCAPSYALRNLGANPAFAGDIAEFQSVLSKGWAVALPDFEGAQSEFIAGLQAGHAVLDGIRAAQSFATAGLSTTTPVGLWGYSGGGEATAWASELQASYAPDLHIAGTSEGGVPSDVGAVVKYIDGGLFAGFEFAGILGLSRAYPEMKLNSVVNGKGAALLAKIKSSCELDILSSSLFTKVDDVTLEPNTIAQPVYQKVIAANKLGARKPVAPVFNYHVKPDEIIPVAPDDAMVAAYCKAGVPVVTSRFDYGDHITGALQGEQGALDFLADRFAGKKVQSTC